MEHVEWSERPDLRRPALVVAFKGWNDAGEAATAALDYLVDSFDATEFARIDPEDFYDFTAVRPTVRLEQGRTRVVDWPHNAFHAAHVAGADQDLILFEGVEPSLRWRLFAGLLIDVARELGAETVITLGALLADVPHSRPVPMTGIASNQELVEKLGFERSTYEGPTGIVGVLHHACAAAGIPSISLWASVPHYVAAAPNPKAALALIRSFEGAAGLAVEARELEESAEDYERQVNAAVASDPDVKSFVERLEQTMDEVTGEMPPERIPSADAIARDFQRFLRQRGPEGPPQGG
ncbi:MAG: PAC2 family protein [Actinomycetota bacterium]|nr:PAC2 family protein [Actinomycetota bacterium]